MKLGFIRKDLVKYVNEEIKPIYKTFDKAHNLSHFYFVTNNCIEYGTELKNRGEKVDLEIAYIVGVMHDIGIMQGRENHAMFSGELVRNNTQLINFFDQETIEIIAQAVEDHSSHLTSEPRNIYGKIVADADRNNSVYLVFSRPVKYAIKHEKWRDRQNLINSVYEFVQNKFGRNGYVKYWLDMTQTKKEQLKIWELLDNEPLCKAYISGIIDEVTKGRRK